MSCLSRMKDGDKAFTTLIQSPPFFGYCDIVAPIIVIVDLILALEGYHSYFTPQIDNMVRTRAYI